jgi:uncharacterized phage-associated protein
MGKVFDVAKYILSKTGKITTWKLQKLVYYSQAWSLVWDDAPLFEEKIKAWANGPVVPELYKKHKGSYYISESFFQKRDVNNLKDYQKETIDRIIDFYGDKSGQWLSDLTHMEEPYKNARKGLSPSERGNNEIILESMSEYYSSL